MSEWPGYALKVCGLVAGFALAWRWDGYYMLGYFALVGALCGVSAGQVLERLRKEVRE